MHLAQQSHDFGADRVEANLDSLLRLKVKSRDGQLVPVSELVEVRRLPREKAIFHKDLLPVVYVVGDMGGTIFVSQWFLTFTGFCPLYPLLGISSCKKET